MSPHDHGRDGDGGGSHGESAAAGGGSVRTLGAVVAINSGGFVVELAGGPAFGSVALVGDPLHVLFDALAYLVALVASVCVLQGGETSPNERTARTTTSSATRAPRWR